MNPDKQRQVDSPPEHDRRQDTQPAASQGRGGNPADRQPGEGTEPRSGERLEHHTSQGLAGAQGSGGGAERGIQQDPGPGRPMANREGGSPAAPPASSEDPARRGDIDR